MSLNTDARESTVNKEINIDARESTILMPERAQSIDARESTVN